MTVPAREYFRPPLPGSTLYPCRGYDGPRTHMIAMSLEPDPCGWEDVYRAYGCPVEYDEDLDDDG